MLISIPRHIPTRKKSIENSEIKAAAHETSKSKGGNQHQSAQENLFPTVNPRCEKFTTNFSETLFLPAEWSWEQLRQTLAVKKWVLVFFAGQLGISGEPFQVSSLWLEWFSWIHADANNAFTIRTNIFTIKSERLASPSSAKLGILFEVLEWVASRTAVSKWQNNMKTPRPEPHFFGILCAPSLVVLSWIRSSL